jgi:hypothetical protein
MHRHSALATFLFVLTVAAFSMLSVKASRLKPLPHENGFCGRDFSLDALRQSIAAEAAPT